MKQLHDKVNIVPVIGKADTLTPAELDHMKRRVINNFVVIFFVNLMITARLPVFDLNLVKILCSNEGILCFVFRS